MLMPTDEELSQCRDRPEDGVIERKTFGDSQDWVKTVVAFANSVPLGRCGVLYVGLRSDGSVEQNTPDLDKVQRTLRRKLEAVFPPISYTSRVIGDGPQKYLCVIVPGSSNRPHFSGAAYVVSALKRSKHPSNSLIA
jgi:predicted HTH transcriptional regulator